MSVELARRVELEGLYDAQEMVVAIVDGAVVLLNEQGVVDRKVASEYAHWLTDAWTVIRDKNPDVLCFGGKRKKVGEIEIYGRINSITADTKLVMNQRIDIGEGLEERTMVSFSSNWLSGQKNLKEVYIGCAVKDIVHDMKVDSSSITLDFEKGNIKLSPGFQS